MPFEDRNQLVLMIDRLKAELSILKDDFEAYGTSEPPKWRPFKYDDSVVPSLTMSRRQDLIGSLLRFLCYSIIRMDPN